MKIKLYNDLITDIKCMDKKVCGSQILKYTATIGTISQLLASLPYVTSEETLKMCIKCIPISYAVALLNSSVLCNSNSVREYHKIKALNNIYELICDLMMVDIYTNRELLSKTELYKIKYNLKLNESKIPYILEQKYILLPTIVEGSKDYDMTPMLQEHVVGTRKYTLEKGGYQKQKKFSLAYNNI